MRIATRSRRVYFPLLILIALALFSSPCNAVTMRITAGFDGVVKSTRWAPVAVQLANPSDEDIEAVLVITEPEGLSTPMPVCTSQVNLPAHSTKLYHVYVRPPGYGGRIRVSLARRYGTLATREAKLNAAAEDDRLIVTVGERAARLSFMQGETVQVPQVFHPGQSSGGSSQATIHAGSLSPSTLPDRPAAYEGADVMVVSGLAPESTDPNALKAICAWVASGGTLVVSTGPDYRAYMNPFYDELLPVKILGAANLPGMQGLSVIGGPTFPAGPAAVAKSTVKPGIGTTLVSESGVPLIVDRRYGAGRVVFLAFDIKAAPFSDWNGQIKFWKRWIMDAAGEPIAPTEAKFAGTAFYGSYQNNYQMNDQMSTFSNVVTQTTSIKTPSIVTVALFLIAYLVILVPVNYAVLKSKRRLELAWLTTPAIVIVFALGAYAIGYTMKGGNLKLCEASLIEGSSNARFARVVTDASVFSPARRSYAISVSDPSAISQIVPMSKEDEPPVAYLGEASVMDDVGMAMWSSKTFEAVGGTDLGGVVTANLTLAGGKLSGQITNNTGIDLRDCVVYSGSAHSSPCSLAKGATLGVQVVSAQSGGVQPQPYSYGDSRLSDRLKTFVQSNAVGSGPVLVGFADPKGVFGVDGRQPSGDRAVCYVFHLDYGQGNAISIAPGMVKAWRESASNNYGRPMNTANGMLSGYLYNGDNFVGVYRMPVPAGFKVTSLTVVGSVNRNTNPGAGSGIVEASIHNQVTGKWDSITIPSAASVPNPANYVGAGGEVKIKYQSSNNSSAEVRCGVSAEAKRQ